MFYKLLAAVLFGAVLILGIEVSYQGVVIENQRVQIESLVEGCLGPQ